MSQRYCESSAYANMLRNISNNSQLRKARRQIIKKTQPGRQNPLYRVVFHVALASNRKKIVSLPPYNKTQ